MWDDSRYSCQISYQWTFLSLLFSVSAGTPRANLQPVSYTLWMPSRNFANESGALLSSSHYTQRYFSTEYDGEINNHLLLSKFISFLFGKGASSACSNISVGLSDVYKCIFIARPGCCLDGFRLFVGFFGSYETEMSTSPKSYWVNILLKCQK